MPAVDILMAMANLLVALGRPIGHRPILPVGVSAMSDKDFRILAREWAPDGSQRLAIELCVVGQVKHFLIDADGAIRLEDGPVLIHGHDMTSLVGNRVRLWLARHDSSLGEHNPLRVSATG
jgi:hypothetical protein